MRVFVVLALTTALLVPVAMAQKPPAPPPQPPPSQPPSRPPIGAPSAVDPTTPREDLVLFLFGRVATSDGTPIPTDAVVERICNNKVRQQVYASSRGDFSMQLGSRTDSFVDASGDLGSQPGRNGKDTTLGISKRDLMSCELRAQLGGFRSPIISLVNLDNFGGRIDVGVIVVQRSTKTEGKTLSAEPYKAPNDARKAYEKGIGAEKKANLASARKHFEAAVVIYPKYTSAWYELGNVLQKEDQREEARRAYTQAVSIDNRFLPPYMSLAAMAYQEKNWTELLALTDHVLEHDPLSQAYANGYIVDLDPVNSGEAYFYNAVANYRLNKIDEAEKSGRKAEHVGMLIHLPQLHLLLSDIYARKDDYANAISEIQTYLEMVPHAKNAEQVREQLAKLEKLNGTVVSREAREHD
jgi:hypothetical protein